MIRLTVMTLSLALTDIHLASSAASLSTVPAIGVGYSSCAWRPGGRCDHLAARLFRSGQEIGVEQPDRLVRAGIGSRPPLLSDADLLGDATPCGDREQRMSQLHGLTRAEQHLGSAAADVDPDFRAFRADLNRGVGVAVRPSGIELGRPWIGHDLPSLLPPGGSGRTSMASARLRSLSGSGRG